MHKNKRKAGLILMSILLAFTSLPLTAADAIGEADRDMQETDVSEEDGRTQESEEQLSENMTDKDDDSGESGATPSEDTGKPEDSPGKDDKTTGAPDNADKTAPASDGMTEKSADLKEPEETTDISNKYDLNSEMVDVRFKTGQTEYIYTGSEIKPDVEVTVKPETSESADPSPDKQEKVIDAAYYTLEYQNNIEAGEASIIVKGKDEEANAQDGTEEASEGDICIGTKTVKFKILPADITDCKVQAPKTADYTGKQVKPKVTLTYQGKELVSGKDYRLDYSNNTKMGTASVKISGTGSFKGSKTVKFTIKFGTPVVKTSSSYSRIKLKWQKVKDAAGYVVYRSTSLKGEYKKVKTFKSGSQTSYSDTKAKFGKTYYYKVRAYRKVKVTVKKKNKTKLEYGSRSAAVNAKRKLSTVAIKSAKCASQTTAKISWNKVTGAQGYEIYMSTAKNGTYKYAGKVSGAAKLSYTAKKLKSGVAYYFKVKAFRKSGSKKYYGGFSAVKKESFTEGQRLYMLFPQGVPTKKAEMEKYLVTITVPIKDADGVPGTMQLRVHKDLTKEFMGAFQDMYAVGFPVRAEDTDTYNWRSMASGKNRSHHSYGCVVDLNWNSNPMIGVTDGTYAPGVDPYSVTPQVAAIWKKHGFYWGGSWKSSKDYMHFTYTNH